MVDRDACRGSNVAIRSACGVYKMTSIASSNSLACTQPCRPQIALIGYQSHFCLVPLLRISKVRLCFRTFEPLKPATLIPTLSTMLLCFRGLFIRHCSVNGNTFKDIVQRTHHVKEFNIARKGLIHEPELVRKQRYKYESEERGIFLSPHS